LIIPVGFSAAFPTIYDLLKDAWYELAIILAKQQHRPRQGRIWLHLFEATLTEMHHSPLYPKAVLILNRIGWNTFPKNKSPREREREGEGKKENSCPLLFLSRHFLPHSSASPGWRIMKIQRISTSLLPLLKFRKVQNK